MRDMGDKKYSLQERNILGVLYAAEKPLTIEAIARRADISRITAKKYLKMLEEKGVLKNKELDRGIYWWIKAGQEVHVKERRKRVYA